MIQLQQSVFEQAAQQARAGHYVEAWATAGSDARARLLQSILRIANFDANLLFQLFFAQSRLAILQFRAVLIGFRDSIAKRDIEIKPDEIIGRRIVEGILQGTRQIGGEVRRFPVEVRVLQSTKARASVETDQ